MIKYLKTQSGNKAKTDIDLFCEKFGYENIAVDLGKGKLTKFFSKTLTMLALPFRIKKGDVLIVQYPYKKYFSAICRTVNLKKGKTITLIHDLGAFRRKKLTPGQENRRLSRSSAIIAHSPAMKEWIEGQGCKVPVIVLDIFDYFSEVPVRSKPVSGALNTIAYAGALGDRKNSFIFDLAQACPSSVFSIYGKGLKTEHLGDAKNIIYKGFTPSDTFINEVSAHWGLVWDGDSVDECSGNWGEYLRINNPHKASFYLRAGIPVIVWAQSAMAAFILANKVGIAVDSLRDLDARIAEITAEEYEAMRKNAEEMARHLNEGYYFRKAVCNCLP